jgi:hypothetical protein
MGTLGDGSAVGINSYATAAPSGFAVSSIAMWSGAGITDARCAFSNRNLHSMMPLDPTHVRFTFA